MGLVTFGDFVQAARAMDIEDRLHAIEAAQFGIPMDRAAAGRANKTIQGLIALHEEYLKTAKPKDTDTFWNMVKGGERPDLVVLKGGADVV